MKILRILLSIIIFGFSVLTGVVVYLLHDDVVDIRNLRHFIRGKPSVILDDQGSEMFRFELDKRSPIAIDVIPAVVIQAFIAVEDHAFFSHGGLSLRGIVRSMLVNMYYGKVVQGASTITQQVARLLYLSHERTWWRKLKEMIIAFQLERRLTKAQILELYLNNMYFGQGIYGVEAACQRFWGKSVVDATLDEAAMLAAIAKSAQFYSPLNAPLTARKRRNTALHCMFKRGFIEEKELQDALDTPLVIEQSTPENPVRQYIYEWIRIWAERTWGREDLYVGGLTIKTTINDKIQAAAEKAFIAMVKKNQPKLTEVFNGGLVTLDVSSGKIRAAVGGLDFKKSQFNRAFKAYRQIGSSIKPYLYALALEKGYDFDQLMVDEQVLIPGSSWVPRNWTRKFEGSMTLARALSMSNNMISIKLGLALGIHPIIEWIKKFGITRELDPYPSFALGTAHASPEQNAAAFNIFANNGVYVAPHLIEWVKDDSGKKIWEYEATSYRVLDTQVNAKMVKVLSHRMNSARYFDEYALDSEAIGKTGSTNEAATMWFVGSTPSLTTAVYLGRDDNKPLGKNVYATQTAMPLWYNLHKEISSPIKSFYLDPTLHEVIIDWWSGERLSRETDTSITILK